MSSENKSLQPDSKWEDYLHGKKKCISFGKLMKYNQLIVSRITSPKLLV